MAKVRDVTLSIVAHAVTPEGDVTSLNIIDMGKQGFAIHDSMDNETVQRFLLETVKRLEEVANSLKNRKVA